MQNTAATDEQKQQSNQMPTHRVLLPSGCCWVKCNAAMAAKWQQIIGGHPWHVEELTPCGG
jgi:hypothetical protein